MLTNQNFLSNRSSNRAGKVLAMLSVCVVLLASGCGDARMERLCGDWKLDVPKSESLVDNLLGGEEPGSASPEDILKNAGKAALESAFNSAENALSQTMTLSFSNDGTWKSETGFASAIGKKSGTWKVLSETGDQLEIEFSWTEPNSGNTETGKTTIQFNDHNSITLVPPNISSTQMELTFKRHPAK